MRSRIDLKSKLPLSMSRRRIDGARLIDERAAISITTAWQIVKGITGDFKVAAFFPSRALSR